MGEPAGGEALLVGPSVGGVGLVEGGGVLTVMEKGDVEARILPSLFSSSINEYIRL